MEFDRIRADLNFVGAVIKEITVKNHIIAADNIAKKEFGMDVVFNLGQVVEGKRSGKVLLQISIRLSSKNEDEEKSEFEILIEGEFTIPESVEEEKAETLLRINGASALYSIARAKVEELSAMSFFNGKLVLPMINMFEFYKSKAEEEQEEQDQ